MVKWDRGLLTSGILAVVLTVLFSLLVFGIDRWREPESAGAGTPLVKILPHVSMGSPTGSLIRYTTTIQIVNPVSDAIVVSAAFFNPDGTASSAAFHSTAQFAPLFEGRLENLTLAGNASVTIHADTAPAYTPLWGRITASVPVVISTTVEYHQLPRGELLGRVAVDASDADMRRFGIARVHDSVRGLDTSFAIVNTGSAPASLTATLRDANGAVLQSTTKELRPNEQVSLFAQQFFGLNDLAGTDKTYQSATFESSSPQFAAIAFAIEGVNISNVPVTRLP